MFLFFVSTNGVLQLWEFSFIFFFLKFLDFLFKGYLFDLSSNVKCDSIDKGIEASSPRLNLVALVEMGLLASEQKLLV